MILTHSEDADAEGEWVTEADGTWQVKQSKEAKQLYNATNTPPAAKKQPTTKPALEVASAAQSEGTQMAFTERSEEAKES